MDHPVTSTWGYDFCHDYGNDNGDHDNAGFGYEEKSTTGNKENQGGAPVYSITTEFEMGQQFSGSLRIDTIPKDKYGNFWEDKFVLHNFSLGTFSNLGKFKLEEEVNEWIFCVMTNKWRGTFMLGQINNLTLKGIFVVDIDGQPHQGWFCGSGCPCAGTYEVQHTFLLYMEKSWCKALRKELVQSYFLELNDILYRERENVCPELEDIYTWTKACPIDKGSNVLWFPFFHTVAKQLSRVDVVILGQDPYPTKTNAHGLAFSMKPGNRPSKSLKRIYKELEFEGLISWGTKPKHGYPMSWAKQGVLLLNTWLTVEEGNPGSHRDIGWETFTDAVITHLNATKFGRVFILWGEPAKKKASLINEVSEKNPKGSHLILRGTHPSPTGTLRAKTDFLSYTKLEGKLVRNKAHQYFKECNVFLKSCGKPEIKWASLLEEQIDVTEENENNTSTDSPSCDED